MRFEIRSCATASILLVSLLCSCGKKEESPPAAAPGPQSAPTAAKPEPEKAPVVQAATEQPAQPAPSKAPEPAAGAVEQNFSGTIGGQPVMVQLSLKEEGGTGRSTVTGSYFLESQGNSNKIPLSGTLQNGSLVLDQTVQGAVTGTFNLMNDSANKTVYLGSWKGLGRVLPVKLVTIR